jgi:NTE family protein
MRIIRIASLLFFVSLHVFAQEAKRPKIGLVLSGGGAKGLAHIGVLEVLDDIGLKVDYITGASMGSIIGALYAAGYSADSIHKIAIEEPWDLMLSNQIPLQFLSPDDRPEYGQYNLSVNWEDRHIKMPVGLLNGHLLGLELSRLTSPVANKKRFSDFPIPFRCVATNIETGKVEVLDSGNVAEALRASMAIPSLFIPVKFNGRYLVDGGVLRNLPVSDAIDMGADIIIGVNVSAGILPARKLTSIASVLFQSVFLAGNEDFGKQKKLTHYLIEPPLENYSAADFDKPDSLIAIGRRQAELYRNSLRQLKDSLSKLYPGQYERKAAIPSLRTLHFGEIEVVGLKHHTAAYVKNQLRLKPTQSISPEALSLNINQLYGTGNFKQIGYELDAKPDSSQNKLIIKVDESSRISAKFDLNYNTLFKTALILGVVARNVIGLNTKLAILTSIGDNIRLRAGWGKYLGLKQNFHISLISHFDQYDLPTAVANQNKITISKLDKMNQYAFGINLQQRILNRWSLNTSVVREIFHINDLVNSNAYVSSERSSCYTLYSHAQFNSLNSVNYPTRGWKISVNGSATFNYNYRFLDIAGHQTDSALSTIAFEKHQINDHFQQLSTSVYHFKPLWKKATLMNSLFTGLTFNTSLTFSHFYRIGGLRENFQRNIPFAGIREFSHRNSVFHMNNILAYQLGFQQETFRNVYVIPRFNVAYTAQKIESFDFAETAPKNFLLGYSVTMAYNSPLGPLELSLMRSNQFDDYMVYVNLGYNFYNR